MEEGNVNRRKGYKFTSKSHTKRGLISSGIGFFSLLLLGGLFYLSYQEAGNMAAYGGFLGFLSMLGAAVGLILAMKSFHEEDKFYLFSYVGCVLNGMLLVGWIILYILGM